MKTSGVSQLSVTTSNECEEPVSALLERILGVSPSIYSNAETGQSIVTAYVRATSARLRKHEPEIRAGLEALRAMGLKAGRGEIVSAPVRKEDWAESWKKHFQPIILGSTLIIKPSWSKIKPAKGQAVVVLDPGLSFGTGQHATTSFCLRQIARLSGAHPPRSLLDMGSGSGILAIAAAKLGFAPVTAFDFDPVAVKIALKNCRLNGVQKKIALSRQDLTKVPMNSRQKYDLICANLISPLLISERQRILNRLNPGGTLVLAGILATEFATVRKDYESSGLRLASTRIEREWQSGAFKRA